MQRNTRTDPFLSLANGLAAAQRVARPAVTVSPRQALEELRRGKDLTDRRRLGLMVVVMGVGRDISIREKRTTLVRNLHTIQMRMTRTPGRRLAVVEAALRLTDPSDAATRWHEDLENTYLKLRSSGAVSDWASAFGVTRDEAIASCNHIRTISRFPDWADPLNDQAVSTPDLPTLKVGVSSGLKVTRLRTNRFRAVPGEIDLDLTSDGKPVSLVIFGDNGVGKSTLVSAIELACQGTVGRQSPTLVDASLSLINLSADEESAAVEVLLSDNTSLERFVELVDGQWSISGDPTPFAFSLSPMTLQRADLVRFLGTPGAKRGQLFVGQFAADGTNRFARAARERLRAAKETRRLFVDDLSARAGHPPRFGSRYIGLMLNAIHLDGMDPDTWRKVRGRVPASYTKDHDRVRAIEHELREARRLQEKMPELELRDHSKQVKRLGELLGDIDTSLTDALVAVTGFDFVERVEVSVGSSGAISLNMLVHLKNGKAVAPERLFSEGVQDLLAILFFVEVAKAAAERGQAKVLVLDDVIQSVDATIRRRLLQQLVSDLKSWQLIITCHDRLWRDHVREALGKAGMRHREIAIRAWDFSGGPLISSGFADASTDLRAMVGVAGPRTVAGSSGLLLETICNHMSWTLPVTITRAREDRYTLGELLDTVRSKTKNSPELATVFAEIDQLVSLRNQLGAHYNQIADSIADSEADRFAVLVLRLWDRVFCAACAIFVRKARPKVYECRCGAVRFST